MALEKTIKAIGAAAGKAAAAVTGKAPAATAPAKADTAAGIVKPSVKARAAQKASRTVPAILSDAAPYFDSLPKGDWRREMHGKTAILPGFVFTSDAGAFEITGPKLRIPALLVSPSAADGSKEAMGAFQAGMIAAYWIHDPVTKSYQGPPLYLTVEELEKLTAHTGGAPMRSLAAGKPKAKVKPSAKAPKVSAKGKGAKSARA